MIKKIIIAIFIILGAHIGAPLQSQAACPSNKQCTKQNCTYKANAYTGNIKDTVDNLVDGYGECLRHGDIVDVTTPGGEFASYTLDADCTTPTNTCSDADAITPANNGGNMRWMLTKPRLDKATTDDLAEGATNKYFNGKDTDDLPEGAKKFSDDDLSDNTQDDLSSGATYKQFDPAAVAITGGSLNGDIPITTTGAVSIQDNSGLIVKDNGGTIRVHFSPNTGYAIGRESSNIAELEISRNIYLRTPWDNLNPYIVFAQPSNGANSQNRTEHIIFSHIAGARVEAVDDVNDLLEVQVWHPYSNLDKFQVNLSVAGLTTATDYYVCSLKGINNNLFTVKTASDCTGAAVDLTPYSILPTTLLFTYSYKCTGSTLCTSDDSMNGSYWTNPVYNDINSLFLGRINFRAWTAASNYPEAASIIATLAGDVTTGVPGKVPGALQLYATNTGTDSGVTTLSIDGANHTIRAQDMFEVDTANTGNIYLGGAVEKVENGSFTGNADHWELRRDNDDTVSEWTYGSNKVTKTAGQAHHLYQPVSVQAGIGYIVTYTLTRTAGDIHVELGNTVGTTRSTSGTYTEELLATDQLGLYFMPSVDFAGSIDDVSVKRVGGAVTAVVDPDVTGLNGDAPYEILSTSTGTNIDTMPLLVQNTLNGNGTLSGSQAKVARFRMIFGNTSGTSTFSGTVTNLANTIMFNNDGNYTFNSAGLKGSSIIFSAGNPTTGGTVSIPTYFAFHSSASDSSGKITFTGSDWAGFKADDFAAPTGGSSPMEDMTVTTVSGVKIDKQTSAGTNNYGLWLNGDGTGADVVYGTTGQLKTSRNATTGNFTVSGGDITQKNMKTYTAFNQTLSDDTDATCDSSTDCIVLPIPTTIGYLEIQDSAGNSLNYTITSTGVPKALLSIVKTTTVIQNSNGWKTFAAGSGSITLVNNEAGKWFELLSVDLFLDWGGTNAFTAGAGDDLIIDSNAVGDPSLSATIETTGWVDATADKGYHVPVLSGVYAHGFDFSAYVNKKIRLSSLSGVNFAGNAAEDNLVRIETTYIEHQATSGYLTGGSIASCGLPYTTGLCVYDAGSTANIINNTGASAVYNIKMVYD